MAPDANPDHTNTSLLTYGAGSKKISAVFVLQLQLHFLVLLHHSQPRQEQLEELGPGNGDFFGPQMALAQRLDSVSQGPKKSRFPGPSPLRLALLL
jgi:hypothetical protein